MVGRKVFLKFATYFDLAARIDVGTLQSPAAISVVGELTPTTQSALALKSLRRLISLQRLKLSPTFKPLLVKHGISSRHFQISNPPFINNNIQVIYTPYPGTTHLSTVGRNTIN